MPTINEVWEQALLINANLATVHNDLTALNNCCQTSSGRLQEIVNRLDVNNQRLQQIRDIADHGFTALADGLAGVQARQDITNQLLFFQAQQQRTMICILEKISHHTCEIWNESDHQTEIEGELLSESQALAHMFASAHADAALAYRRHLEDAAELAECCPPKPRKPPCSYEPCPEPKLPDRRQPEPFEGYRPAAAATAESIEARGAAAKSKTAASAKPAAKSKAATKGKAGGGKGKRG